MSTLNALGLAMLLVAFGLACLFGRYDGPRTAAALVAITAAAALYFGAAGALLAQ